ncbi:hypothetical protein EUGRSUZ_I00299 [Eucalyptus grandis]|uniref:Uncharacterized protein n=2 Tax=Eucalyptus grandis TaxID=71139 RepID=A0A059ALR3_EUCGR|nr:hypothetical protein EUGRSUZ_I00299 [Eucalyptus grandis]
MRLLSIQFKILFNVCINIKDTFVHACLLSNIALITYSCVMVRLWDTHYSKKSYSFFIQVSLFLSLPHIFFPFFPVLYYYLFH